MKLQRHLTLIVFSVVFLLFVAGCDGGGEVVGGASTTPFLGGTQGLEIGFLEGSPPEEVTDGDTFDFSAVVNMQNKGEYNLKKEEVNVSLIGFLPDDFGITDDAATTDVDERDVLISVNPEDNPGQRKKDSEGNIIEPVETFVTFPPDPDAFNFKEKIPGNTVFVFRADVCYKYVTDALSEICVLENLVDVGDGAICDPSESKNIFSSASPVGVTSFKQNVAGKNKIQFSFDVVHSGSGTLYKPGGETGTRAECPKNPSEKRKVESKVNITVSTGLANTAEDVTASIQSLKCVGLMDASNGADVDGVITLVNGKRTVTCTQNLEDSRTDFKKNVNINVSFSYLESVDREVLVKHLID